VTKMKVTVHGDRQTGLCTYMVFVVTRRIILAMFQIKFVGKIKAHILCSVTVIIFFRKSRLL